MVLFRESYQDDIHTPLSYEKLEQIATYNIYRRYLKQSENGQWEINDSFFERLYKNDAYNYPFTTQEAWEASYLQAVKENRSKKANY